jgi:hypothetical protein
VQGTSANRQRVYDFEGHKNKNTWGEGFIVADANADEFKSSDKKTIGKGDENIGKAVFIAYEGERAKEVKFVQFIWIELIITHRIGHGPSWQNIIKTIPPATSGFADRQTSTAKNPVWAVDTGSKTDPVYTSRGVGDDNSDTMSWIADRPNPAGLATGLMIEYGGWSGWWDSISGGFG